MPASGARRGRCPRCRRPTIHHFVFGFPDVGSFCDEAGDLPAWIHFTGCVLDPEPTYDRACEDCGLRWTSSSGGHVVVSTWRELRDRVGVATNREANDWLGRQVRASTVIVRFPALDDPQGRVVVRHGVAQETLRFPFTYAEWESTLLDLVEKSSRRRDDALAQGTEMPPEPGAAPPAGMMGS